MKTRRTDAEIQADRIKASRMAAAARTAKKVPSCTIRVPEWLKARLETLTRDGESLWQVVDRATAGREVK